MSLPAGHHLDKLGRSANGAKDDLCRYRARRPGWRRRGLPDAIALARPQIRPDDVRRKKLTPMVFTGLVDCPPRRHRSAPQRRPRAKRRSYRDCAPPSAIRSTSDQICALGARFIASSAESFPSKPRLNPNQVSTSSARRFTDKRERRARHRHSRPSPSPSLQLPPPLLFSYRSVATSRLGR